MARTSDDSGSRTIAAVDKGCQIIKGLHELDGATLTEIADYLELTPGTVHPHLRTLIENELIVRNGQEYYPSLQFLKISKHRLQNNPLHSYAMDEIETLAREKNARAQIYVEEFGRAVCIGIAGSDESILPPANVGQHSYMHCLAAGKAMLAAYTDERVRDIIERRGLPRLTEQTIVDEEELFEELEDVSEREYALNDEEYMPGLRAVGAPISDDGGTVLGSISVSKPTKVMDDTEFREELPQTVASVANRIEINIRVGEGE